MRLLLLPVLLLLAGCNGSDEPKTVVGQMPTCDSKYTRNLLVRAIHESPAGQRGIKVVQVGTVDDFIKEPDEKAKVEKFYEGGRYCEAHLFTNAGEGQVQFYLKWIDDKKDKVWLQLTGSSI
jgi:hypothetical protein